MIHVQVVARVVSSETSRCDICDTYSILECPGRCKGGFEWADGEEDLAAVAAAQASAPEPSGRGMGDATTIKVLSFNTNQCFNCDLSVR